MKAQDIMTKNPSCVTPETRVQDAARLMKNEDVGIIPVVESQGSMKLVGVITDRDIAIRVVADGAASSNSSVRDVMTSNITTSAPGDSVKDVMELMGREQVRRIPIVDKGELVGIIAQADIVREADDKRAERTVEKISEPGGRTSH
jgi:CBS domain-containing protein